MSLTCAKILISNHVSRVFSKCLVNFKDFRGYSMSPVVNVDCHLSSESVELAVKHLRLGDIISLPTDTVYGIAADAQNSLAIAQLFEVKSREARKPVAICVSDPKDVGKWCKLGTHIPNELLHALLPGPVTLVLERKADLNPDLNPGIASVGIRIPDHPFIREVARMLDSPLALTSANISSEQSSLSVEEFSHMWNGLGAVFNGGHLGDSESAIARLGSTVVDLVTPGYFHIIRPGCALQKTASILKGFGLRE